MKPNREGWLVGPTQRECTSCHKIFEITSGMTLCKACNSTRVKSLSPEWRMHQRAKVRAKVRGLEFNIEVSDIEIPEECPVLGIPLVVNSGRSGAYRDSPSLDRIDSAQGYIKGNIQVISQQANAMKYNASKEDLLMFARWIFEVYDENC